MATQGIVSVTRDGRAIVKAVAGCNGMQAGKLVEAIKARRELVNAETVMLMAQRAFFGCPACLVVLDEQEALGAIDELPSLYRQTFDDPRFNPRWHRGTADYVEVVEIGEGKGIRTRFISRERYDLFRRLIEQHTRKRLEEEGELPSLYVGHRPSFFGRGRAYLVHDTGGWIDPCFRKRVKYRPVPEQEGEA